MHDLDRRMFEAEVMGGEMEEAEQQEEQEFRELLGALVQGGGGRAGELGRETFEAVGAAGELDDRVAREVAQASELLEVQTSAELEQFLGTLLRRVTGAGRGLARSATGRALGAILKQAATQALPMVADAVGTPAAPRAATLGSADGQSAAELGLELEGLSQEDREFEVARAFVRFADAAARIAAQAPQTLPPTETAGAAATTAAQRHLPGLLAPPPGGGSRGREHSGRWVRQGNKIVVDGA